TLQWIELSYTPEHVATISSTGRANSPSHVGSRSLEGQGESEGRAAAETVLGPDRAAVQPHDRTRDRQAQAQAFVLGRVERIEQLVLLRRLEAFTLVEHRDGEMGMGARDSLGADLQGPLLGGRAQIGR